MTVNEFLAKYNETSFDDLIVESKPHLGFKHFGLLSYPIAKRGGAKARYNKKIELCNTSKIDNAITWSEFISVLKAKQNQYGDYSLLIANHDSLDYVMTNDYRVFLLHKK